MSEKKKTKRHLTILHSNDLHASFIEEKAKDGHLLLGGFPRLAGYIEQVQKLNPKKTMYLCAGDLFAGNLIDYDSKGIESIKLLNQLKPDAVCIGNHSIDHTVQRLGFLDHFCDFPVLCANLYIKGMNRPFLKPYTILKKNGIRILLIGVVTEEIMDRSGKDPNLEEYIEFRDPAIEIKNIIYNLDTSEIDLTIILSHLGYEKDIQLAKNLEYFYNVDLIIGGHSHTLPDEAVEENGIRIVQAGKGSNQIGRFEITVDTKEHKMDKDDLRWDLITIDSGHGTKKDPLIDLEVTKAHQKILEKYSEQLLQLEQPLEKELEEGEENRYKENKVGNFFSDLLFTIFNEDEDINKHIDLCLIGSGSLRKDKLEKDFTRLQLREMYSQNEVLYRISMTGKELKHAMLFALKKAPLNRHGHGEYYQVSRGWKFWWNGDPEATELEKAELNNNPIKDDDIYSIGIEDYHYGCLKKYLDTEPKGYSVLTWDTNATIEEYLRKHKEYQPCYQLEKRTWREI